MLPSVTATTTPRVIFTPTKSAPLALLVPMTTIQTAMGITTTITTTTPPHSLMAGRVAVSTLVLCACTAPCWTRRGGQYRAPTDLWD
eukprot:m.137475 g.137475  ORF g.137475 m.137475 type:complete len:87 (-) comp14899_c0_seq4:425-685(-)